MNPLVMIFGLLVGLMLLRNIAAVITIIWAGYMAVMLGLFLHDLGSRTVGKVKSWTR
jgi:hypothetical protein